MSPPPRRPLPRPRKINNTMTNEIGFLLYIDQCFSFCVRGRGCSDKDAAFILAFRVATWVLATCVDTCASTDRTGLRARAHLEYWLLLFSHNTHTRQVHRSQLSQSHPTRHTHSVYTHRERDVSQLTVTSSHHVSHTTVALTNDDADHWHGNAP